jgi:hypothetical protein
MGRRIRDLVSSGSSRRDHQLRAGQQRRHDDVRVVDSAELPDGWPDLVGSTANEGVTAAVSESLLGVSLGPSLDNLEAAVPVELSIGNGIGRVLLLLLLPTVHIGDRLTVS